MKTTPKRNDAFRIRQKSRKPKEKTTLKEKQIHSLDKVKKPKEKTTLTTLKEKQIHSFDKVKKPKEKTTLTMLKEKQIHSQENDTQRRLKNASKKKKHLL